MLVDFLLRVENVAEQAVGISMLGKNEVMCRLRIVFWGPGSRRKREIWCWLIFEVDFRFATSMIRIVVRNKCSLAL